MSSTSHENGDDRAQRPGQPQQGQQDKQPDKQIDPHVLTPEDNPWLFTAEEVAETPSRLQDLPREAEMRVVAKTFTYLQDCAKGLNVPQLTTSVALKFFQRFFMLESMLETVRRLRDVIFWTVKVRTRNTADYPDGMEMLEKSTGYFEEKNNILDKEREVLRVLNFDLNIDHPYGHLWTLARAFLPATDPQRRDEQRNVFQGAWNFCNDSFRTYLHMRYDAKEIATATLFLGAKLNSISLPDGTQRDPITGKRLLAWHEFYAVDLLRVEDICNQLLDLYDPDVSKPASVLANGAGVLDSVPELPPAKRRKIEDTGVSGNSSS